MPRAESGPIFNFYMGKNTPERKDNIMGKLAVPVEEKKLVSSLLDGSVSTSHFRCRRNFEATRL